MNRVQESGNLGRDPELRSVANGMRVASYSLGVTRPNPKDKEHPLTDWLNVIAWNEQADLVMANLKKGTKVLVNGKLQSRSYEDKDGKKVYVTEIVQDDFWLAPKKNDSTPEDELPW